MDVFHKVEHGMMTRPRLQRKDTVARILMESINRLQFQPIRDVEKAIEVASAKARWIEVAAMGWVYAQSSPASIRGYLAYIDGLINLSLIQDAQDAVGQFLALYGRHPLLVKRQCSLHMRTKQWRKIIEFLEPDDDAWIVDRAIESAINLKEFDQAKQFLSRTTSVDMEKRVAQAQKDWDDDLVFFAEKYKDKAIETSLQASYDNNDFRAFVAASWLAYRSPFIGEEIFELLIKPVKGEFEYYPRVSFFRSLAAEHYPFNDAFLFSLSTTLVFENRLDEAFAALRRISVQGQAKSEVRWRIEHLRRLLFEFSAPESINGRVKDSLLARMSKINFFARKGDRSENVRLFDEIENDQGDAVFLDYLSRAKVPIARSNPVKRTPKVALCISGQMRGFHLTWPSIQEKFVKPFGADVFLHTWSTESYTPPLFRRLSRFVGTSLVNLLPLELQQTLAFSKRFPRTSKRLQEPVHKSVSAQDLMSLVKSEFVVVENEVELAENGYFPSEIWHRGNSNQAKMFYKIFQCDFLRQRQEKISGQPYDVVIRIRPDFNISVESLESYLREVIEDPSKIFLSYVNPDGCGDQFAFGGSDAMSAYANIWPNLIAKKSFKFCPGFRGGVGEELLGEHLMASGLHTQLLPPSNAELVNDLVINLIDIRAELGQDLAETGPSPEVMPFVVAINKHYETGTSKASTKDPRYLGW